MRFEYRLPALTLFPGDSLAQLAACAALGNCPISTPSSATNCSATRRPIPGMPSQIAIAASQVNGASAAAAAGLLALPVGAGPAGAPRPPRVSRPGAAGGGRGG